MIQGPGELLLFDPATNTPLRAIAVGKQPHWIAVANGGSSAVVTNEGSNDVAIVDLATGATRMVRGGKGAAQGRRADSRNHDVDRPGRNLDRELRVRAARAHGGAGHSRDVDQQ